MKLQYQSPPRRLISLVSMVDVLLIMLVFFMVTSTYLNLGMIPMAERGDAPPAGAAAAEPVGEGAAENVMLIRLGADGIAHVQGRPQTSAGLAGLIAERVAANPATQVIVLPSGQASTQALVSLMDSATSAGATRLRIIRLEARP
jgi:biopolymer transport protein ExbD